jgi:hypothetical protein
LLIAWSRDYGSIQLVWCAHHLPLLIAPKEHVHGMMVHDSAADMHCVSDMHHMNSLNAIDAPVYHVHGAWSRDYGSIQLVWCAHLRLLIAPKEHVPGYLFCLLIDELVAFAWLLAACYFFCFHGSNSNVPSFFNVNAAPLCPFVCQLVSILTHTHEKEPKASRVGQRKSCGLFLHP